MALVNYANSDSSEYEDEANEQSTAVILNKHVEARESKYVLLFCIK